jgi:hypothetical protein
MATPSYPEPTDTTISEQLVRNRGNEVTLAPFSRSVHHAALLGGYIVALMNIATSAVLYVGSFLNDLGCRTGCAGSSSRCIEANPKVSS